MAFQMITRLRSGNEIQYRAFTLSDMTRYGWTDSLSFNPLGERELRGIPAINRAARLRSEAVAGLRLYCWSGERERPLRRSSVWQAKLFDQEEYNEYQTRFCFWETVEESLAYRNKASIWKNLDPISGQVIEMFALHPDQVICKPDYYEVRVMGGFVDPVGRGPATYEVDESTLLHIRGHGQGGALEPPTPIQLFRDALAGPVGRQRHEARMWRRGTALQVAVSFPAGVSAQQADEWRESWRSNYEGTEGETTAVIGGGASIVPIGMTAADAQFVDMAKLTVFDAARIMGVPANLLGTQLERSVPNLEQDLSTWFRFGLDPELKRIESALAADEELFGNAQTWPMFYSQEFVRGDILTEATSLGALVQQGVITADEARARLWGGLEPLPNDMGSMPQLTPVGGAPNPNPLPSVSPAMQNGSSGE